MLLNPVFLPYFALFNAAFSPNATTLVTPSTFTLHNIVFVFSELSSTQLALKTPSSWHRDRDRRTLLALVIAYVTTRQVIAGHRVLGFLATAPIAVPVSCSASACSELYAAALRAVRHVVDPADRLPDHHLPSAYQQLQAASPPSIPNSRTPAVYLARPGCSRCSDHRAAVAHRCDRDLVLHLHRRDARALRGHRAVHLQTKVISVLIYDLNESGDLAAISVLGIAMLVITLQSCSPSTEFRCSEPMPARG